MPSKRKDSVHTTPSTQPTKKLKESHAEDTEFRVVKAALTLSVPPVFAANPRAGVEEMLDSMIMRYNSSLEGVVLAHSNLTFTSKTATIQADCPFLVCHVAFEATVWSPRVGIRLVGKVNLCSPDHVSLLVHRTFNVSIPRHHIVTDDWDFEYGPAENDSEFAAAAQEEGDDATKEQQPETSSQSSGKWVHKMSGQSLGGPTGRLEFTVIGLTVANEMLSLLGSLQPDPFSPRHRVQQHAQKAQEKDAETEDDAEEEESGTDSGSSSDSDSGEEDDSDNDTFQALGKRKDLHDLKQKVTTEQSSAPKKKRK